MKIVKIVANILFLLFRGLAWLYALTWLYAGLVLIFDMGLLELTKENTRLTIFYPFTTVPFLLAENNTIYITEMMMGIGLYALFLYLLSNVFLSFRRDKLFTKENVKHLQWFYRANLVLPALALLVISIISSPEEVMMVLVVLHGVLGVFAFFMAAIFRQGLNLQNEQDLFI